MFTQHIDRDIAKSNEEDAVRSTLRVHDNNGTWRPATGDEIISAARLALARRVRRGTAFTSPQLTRDYLRVKLGTLEHEIFSVLLLDLCGVAVYVYALRSRAQIKGFPASLLNITKIGVQSADPHFARILGAHHAYPDIPFLLFDGLLLIDCNAVDRGVLGVA